MRRYIRLFITAVILMLLLSTNVFAWMPDCAFWCKIDPSGIPVGTVYVDLLLPISENDPGYTPFHQNNGVKFGISANSEIVVYQQDGFRSYTFHIVDAYGEMRPYYNYDFSVSWEVYNQHSIRLEEYEEYCFVFRDGESRQYTMQVYRGSEEERQINDLAEILGISLDIDRKNAYTEYNTNNSVCPDRYSDYDYQYCRDTYREAKLAYLDADGNVLGVSNEVSIAPIFGEGQLNIHLSGLQLMTNPEIGPPYWLLYLAPVAVVCGFTLYLIFLRVRKAM